MEHEIRLTVADFKIALYERLTKEDSDISRYVANIRRQRNRGFITAFELFTSLRSEFNAVLHDIWDDTKYWYDISVAAEEVAFNMVADD